MLDEDAVSGKTDRQSFPYKTIMPVLVKKERNKVWTNHIFKLQVSLNKDDLQ